MSAAQLNDYSVICPQCFVPLYIRHVESGLLDREQGKHYVTSVFWKGECHNDDCHWESPRRSTEWGLIQYIDQQLKLKREQPATE